MGKAATVAQRDAEMQPKRVLRIEVERDDLLAGPRQATGNIRGERRLADTAFRRSEADQGPKSLGGGDPLGAPRG